MTRNRIYLTLIVVIPLAAAVGWWFGYPHYQQGRAERALAAGDFERAADLLKQITRQQPDSYRPYSLYAQALRRLGRPAEAQAILLLAVRHGLPEADGRREFALAEVLKGFTPRAEENLRRVAEERPGDLEVWQALADGCAAQRRWRDAEECYTQMLKAEPDRAETWLARGKMRLKGTEYQVGQPAAAAADFREVLRRRPDDYDARLALAQALIADAKMAAAHDEFLACVKQRPDRTEPLIGLALCAAEDRHWDDAEKRLRQAIALDQKSWYALGMLGDLYVRQQKFKEAVPYFQQVLELNPQSEGTHLKLAQAYRFLGDAHKAAEEEKIYQQLRAEKDNQ